MKETILLILTVLILTSCNSQPFVAWKNDNIDKDKKEQIRILNDKLFKGLRNNDVVSVKSLLSDALLEKSGSDLENVVRQVSSYSLPDNYRILDEYNIRNSTTGISNTIPSGLSGENDYIIKFLALNKEMYVSLILPKGFDHELLITIIYGKYGNDWKINVLQFNQYSFFGKTAPDYFKIAKERYEKSYLIDAVNNISISKQCLRPAVSDIFQYLKEKEINEFYDKVMTEVNTKFKFPMTLDEIKTKPQIFRITPELVAEGFVPTIFYLTEINLKDTAALKIEYEQIKNKANQLFIGINKDKQFVFYWAFNEIPIGQNKVNRYGFIDKLTK